MMNENNDPRDSIFEPDLRSTVQVSERERAERMKVRAANPISDEHRLSPWDRANAESPWFASYLPTRRVIDTLITVIICIAAANIHPLASLAIAVVAALLAVVTILERRRFFARLDKYEREDDAVDENAIPEFAGDPDAGVGLAAVPEFARLPYCNHHDTSGFTGGVPGCDGRYCTFANREHQAFRQVLGEVVRVCLQEAQSNASPRFPGPM